MKTEHSRTSALCSPTPPILYEVELSPGSRHYSDMQIDC